jgi:hypothetical protein
MFPGSVDLERSWNDIKTGTIVNVLAVVTNQAKMFIMLSFNARNLTHDSNGLNCLTPSLPG